MKREIKLHQIMLAVTFLMSILLVGILVWGVREGIFQNNQQLIKFIQQFGFTAPLIFMLIQMIQVIFPVIPGGASCLAGVMLFGSWHGFIYNYIGLCIGSFCAYFLSKKWGEPLIRQLFREDQVNKYLGYLHTNQFKKIFALGIFVPGAPDDLLCYIAGVAKLPLKTFAWILFLGKPLTLLGYSFFMNLSQTVH